MANPALNNENVDTVPTGSGDGASGDQARPANEDLDALSARLKDWFKLDRDHSHDWREEAREAYDFVAGRQWTQAEEDALKEQLRVPAKLNRIEPMVNTVTGLEVGNRQEVRYIPRTMGDVGVNHLLTEAARWIRDECDAEDEESGAFRDAVIGGMGWTSTSLDYCDNPEGMIEVARIDPFEMYWDAGSIRANLSDARRLFRVRDVPLAEAMEMFPGLTAAELHAGWAGDMGQSQGPHDATAAKNYPDNSSGQAGDSGATVRMAQCQWWDYKYFYRGIDPITGQEHKTDAIGNAILTERYNMLGLPWRPVQQKTREYKKAFIGANILAVEPGPADGGFTWKCITAQRDLNKGTWYGIVRAMIDPQRLMNKLLSLTINTVRFGGSGYMAEADAFDDIRAAEQDMTDTSRIVLTSPGAISGGKIMTKPPVPLPPGLVELLPFSEQSIRGSSGINLELLGLVEKDQPGIVEHMRKQAGMTVLAGLFDSLRRYRKEQGRLLLWYITNYLTDGRLIRIGGAENAKYVPLLREEGAVQYDVIVDDTPTSPNMKERTWAILMQMMPFLSRAPVPPQMYMELFKWSPLPESLVAKMEQIANQAMQTAQQAPERKAIEARAMYEGAKADLTAAQAAKTKMDTILGSHQVQATNARTQVEAAKAMLGAEEVKARIESLRAQAMLNLSKAGATQADAQTDQLLGVLDLLDTVVSWRQTERQMEQQPREAA